MTIRVEQDTWPVLIEKLSSENCTCVIVGAQPDGCSGYKYTFRTYPALPEDIQNFDYCDGFYAAIEPTHYEILSGSVLVWEGQDEFSKKFVVKNPNSDPSGTCGCGESWRPV